MVPGGTRRDAGTLVGNPRHLRVAVSMLSPLPRRNQASPRSSSASAMVAGGQGGYTAAHNKTWRPSWAALSVFLSAISVGTVPNPDTGRTSTVNPTVPTSEASSNPLARLADCQIHRFAGSPGHVLRSSAEDSFDMSHRHGHRRDAQWRRWQPSRATFDSQSRISSTRPPHPRPLFHLPLYL